MKRSFVRILILFCLLVLAGTNASIAQFVGPSKTDYESILKDVENDVQFDKFINKLPKSAINLDGEERTYFVLEGDLLLSREQVRSSLRLQSTGERLTIRSGELKVMTVAGGLVYWPRGQRNLTYAVSRPLFPNDALYQETVTRMAAAARDWENACQNCGLTIRHQPQFDANPNHTLVTFIVGYVSNPQPFIAAAFFPHEPAYRRWIVIAPGFWTTSANKTGVLRHELGHVLGYRHEHIGGVMGCNMEDSNWVPISQYDPISTMHYFCGGGGTLQMELSPIDKQSHSALYGR